MRRLLLACLLAFAAPLAVAQTPPTTAEVETVVVVGDWAGPELWHFDGPQGEVFILGTVQPLPKSFTWQTKRLDLVLKRTDRVLIGENSVRIGLGDVLTRRDAVRNPDGAKLSDQLDARTRERLVAQRQDLGLPPDAFENWRPYVAGAMLVNRAYDRAGLGGKVDATALTLAKLKKRGIKPSNVFRAPTRDLIGALNTMPLGADAPCMDAYLKIAEHGLDSARTRAVAWAKGDVATLRATRENNFALSCLSALEHGGVPVDRLVGQFKADWLKAMLAAKDKPGVTLAIVPMSYLLNEDGLLAQLAAAGVKVEGP
jgi:uncharacterized protein YbaP (TraB family)